MKLRPLALISTAYIVTMQLADAIHLQALSKFFSLHITRSTSRQNQNRCFNIRRHKLDGGHIVPPSYLGNTQKSQYAVILRWSTYESAGDSSNVLMSSLIPKHFVRSAQS
jgi:hypothetical protein